MIRKNMAEPGMPQLTIWRTRITCWMPKTTNIHSEHVILLALPVQQSLHEHASMLRYTYIDCLVHEVLHNKLKHFLPTLLMFNNTEFHIVYIGV